MLFGEAVLPSRSGESVASRLRDVEDRQRGMLRIARHEQGTSLVAAPETKAGGQSNTIPLSNRPDQNGQHQPTMTVTIKLQTKVRNAHQPLLEAQ